MIVNVGRQKILQITAPFYGLGQLGLLLRQIEKGVDIMPNCVKCNGAFYRGKMTWTNKTWVCNTCVRAEFAESEKGTFPCLVLRNQTNPFGLTIQGTAKSGPFRGVFREATAQIKDGTIFFPKFASATKNGENNPVNAIQLAGVTSVSIEPIAIREAIGSKFRRSIGFAILVWVALVMAALKGSDEMPALPLAPAIFIGFMISVVLALPINFLFHLIRRKQVHYELCLRRGINYDEFCIALTHQQLCHAEKLIREMELPLAHQ